MIDIKKLYHFFNNVTIKLNIYNWKLILKEDSSEGFCSKKKKVIYIGLKYDGDLMELIIHEISHIRTCRFCNNKHNNTFWIEFENNMKKFMRNKKISNHWLEYKSIISNTGFYRRCYQ